MHSTAQAYTKAIRFTVETPCIKLTKNALLPQTGTRPTKQTSTEYLQNKQIASDNEKATRKKSEQKIWDDLFLFTRKREIELTETLFRHISSLLILMLLVDTTRNQASYIINSTPAVWILPIFLKLARNEKKAKLPKIMTMVYCILFPIWLWVSKKTEKTYASTLLSFVIILVVITANIQFTSWVAWVVFAFVACMHVPLLFIVPQTGTVMYIVCVIVIIIMYHYKENTPIKNTTDTEARE